MEFSVVSRVKKGIEKMGGGERKGTVFATGTHGAHGTGD